VFWRLEALRRFLLESVDDPDVGLASIPKAQTKVRATRSAALGRDGQRGQAGRGQVDRGVIVWRCPYPHVVISDNDMQMKPAVAKKRYQSICR
jgi:hypothetical protein